MVGLTFPKSLEFLVTDVDYDHKIIIVIKEDNSSE